MKTIHALRSGLGRVGRPVVFWLGLGLFFGWLTAPDFLRHYEQSIAGAPAEAPRNDFFRSVASRWGEPRSGTSGVIEIARPAGSEADGPSAEEPLVTIEIPEELEAYVVEAERIRLLPTDGEREIAEATSSSADVNVASAERSPGFVDVASAGSGYGAGSNLIPASFSGGAPSGGGSGTTIGATPTGGSGSSGGSGPGSSGGGSAGPGNGGGDGGFVPVGDDEDEEEEDSPLFLALLEALAAAAQTLLDNPVDRGVVIVDFLASASQAQIEDLVAMMSPDGSAQSFENVGLVAIPIPDAADPELVASILDQFPFVRDAEPSYRRVAASVSDPSFDAQWGLENLGQSGGLRDADIDAPEGWDRVGVAAFTHRSRVGVAVLDTGFADHEDLPSAKEEWTFTGALAIPRITAGGEDHGTAVLGAIAGIGNNGRGIAGVSWDPAWTDIYLAKVAAADDGLLGLPILSDLAIVQAIDSLPAWVQVANLSFSGQQAGSVCDAIARRPDVLFVAAAGNSGSAAPAYPAACSASNVLAVAASTNQDTLWGSSNRGSYVDVAAPGSKVYTTEPGGYGNWSGTSISAGVVSGIAALTALHDPSLGAAALAEQISSRSDVTLGLVLYGFGRANLCRSVGGNCAYLPLPF